MPYPSTITTSSNDMPSDIYQLSRTSWDETDLTFTFPENGGAPNYYNGRSIRGSRPENDTQEFTPEMQEFTRNVLNDISDFTLLSFQEVDIAGDYGNLTFGLTSMDSGTAGFAYYPSQSRFGGDVWLNDDIDYLKNMEELSYGPKTILHEIGHALGLGHSFDFNGSLSYEETVMAYPDNRPWGGDYPFEMRPYDVAALQLTYGTNDKINSGNDVYKPGYNDDIKTIVDAGGRDTVDLRRLDGGVDMSLQPGSLNTVGAHENGFALAHDVAGKGDPLMEDLLSGRGNDTLEGNEKDNLIKAGDGNDLITATMGNDTIDGGRGYDSMDYSAQGLFENFLVTVRNLSEVVVEKVQGLGRDIVKDVEKFIWGDKSYTPQELRDMEKETQFAGTYEFTPGNDDFSSYGSGQNEGGSLTTPGDTGLITMGGNQWLSLDLPDDLGNIGDNVWLQGTLEINGTMPEIVGLGLDNNSYHEGSDRIIQLAGDQFWGQDGPDYNEAFRGQQAFSIDLSQFNVASDPDRLALVVDNDDPHGLGGVEHRVSWDNLRLTTEPQQTSEQFLDLLDNHGPAGFTPYSGSQDGSGEVFVQGGEVVGLQGNKWVELPVEEYQVSENTTLQFEFRTDGQVEIQAIGLDNDGDFLTGPKHAQVAGTQDNPNFNRISDQSDISLQEWQSYKVDVEELGLKPGDSIDRVTFVHDNDAIRGSTVADAGPTSMYRNIRLVEEYSSASSSDGVTTAATTPANDLMADESDEFVFDFTGAETVPAVDSAGSQFGAVSGDDLPPTVEDHFDFADTRYSTLHNEADGSGLPMHWYDDPLLG